MSSIINQSRYIVQVARRPELSLEFPHAKAAEAEAYKATLLAAKGLVAEIERGPLQLLVRTRTPGWPAEAKRVRSYAEAEEYEAQIRADQIRGVRANPKAARETSSATFIQRYIDEECKDHNGREVEIGTLKGMLNDSLGTLAREIEEFEAAKKRGENPKPIKARRQPRTNLSGCSAHLSRRNRNIWRRLARLVSKRVVPATVDRELELRIAKATRDQPRRCRLSTAVAGQKPRGLR